jgi:hypothetical protein
MTIEEIEKAIATVKDSRRSHETWLIWYERHPEDEEKFGEPCGDRQWQRDCITGYDQVLIVLDAYRNKVLEERNRQGVG